MPRVKTAAKERAILDAAASVFARRPFHAVLIDEIASDAGIGKGTIYRYFETKDDLYSATTVHVLGSLAQTLAETLPNEPSPVCRLERIAVECLRFYWDRKHLFPFMIGEGGSGRSGELMKRRETIMGFTQEAIAAGIASGDFRGVDARIGAELFLGMVRSANLYHLPDDAMDALVAQIMSVFLRGVTRADA